MRNSLTLLFNPLMNVFSHGVIEDTFQGLCPPLSMHGNEAPEGTLIRRHEEGAPHSVQVDIS